MFILLNIKCYIIWIFDNQFFYYVQKEKEEEEY